MLDLIPDCHGAKRNETMVDVEEKQNGKHNRMKKFWWLGLFLGGLSLTACAQEKTRASRMAEATDMQAYFDAVKRDDVAMVEAGLATPGLLTATNERGETLLMAAVYAQRPRLIRRLIEAGADVNAQDERLNSPFLYAGAEGDLETVRLALAHGADFTRTNRYGGTALIPAAEKGHLAVVTLLANTPNYPIDHVNQLGWTALLEAVILGDGGPAQQAIVATLLAAGADAGIPDHTGVTALIHARQKGLTEIVALLEAARG